MNPEDEQAAIQFGSLPPRAVLPRTRESSTSGHSQAPLLPPAGYSGLDRMYAQDRGWNYDRVDAWKVNGDIEHSCIR